MSSEPESPSEATATVSIHLSDGTVYESRNLPAHGAITRFLQESKNETDSLPSEFVVDVTTPKGDSEQIAMRRPVSTQVSSKTFSVHIDLVKTFELRNDSECFFRPVCISNYHISPPGEPSQITQAQWREVDAQLQEEFRKLTRPSIPRNTFFRAYSDHERETLGDRVLRNSETFKAWQRDVFRDLSDFVEKTSWENVRENVRIVEMEEEELRALVQSRNQQWPATGNSSLTTFLVSNGHSYSHALS